MWVSKPSPEILSKYFYRLSLFLVEILDQQTNLVPLFACPLRLAKQDRRVSSLFSIVFETTCPPAAWTAGSGRRERTIYLDLMTPYFTYRESAKRMGFKRKLKPVFWISWHLSLLEVYWVSSILSLLIISAFFIDRTQPFQWKGCGFNKNFCRFLSSP